MAKALAVIFFSDDLRYRWESQYQTSAPYIWFVYGADESLYNKYDAHGAKFASSVI